MAIINLVPYKPVAGVASDATAIDNAFDTIQTFANGGIDNNNVAAGAGIDPLKIAGTLGKIYDSTASSAVANFDIPSIPSTYAHLVLRVYPRGDTAANTIGI